MRMRTSTRCVRPRFNPGGQAGISLIEVVLAMALFSIVAIGVGSVITSAIASHGLARERTLAQQHAQGQIEELRRRPYSELVTTTMTPPPPGSIPASRPIQVRGLKGTLQTEIVYVDDKTATSSSTTAHYKRVTVTVLRSRDSKELTRAVTNVPPPTGAPIPGWANAAINATLIDLALNKPVTETVYLNNGPSSPRDGLTDGDGLVSFTDLTTNPTAGPQSFYDIFVGGLRDAIGPSDVYETLREDKPPASPSRVQLKPGQTFNTTIRVYLSATINVTLLDSDGKPYVDAATVSVSSSRGAEEFASDGNGKVTVYSVAGEKLVPNLQYTVGAYAYGPPDGKTLYRSEAETRVVPDAYPDVRDSSFELWLVPEIAGVESGVGGEEGK